MASRYDENTKARAVRLVREHGGDYETEWAAMKAISARLGMSAETLRKWVRQAEVDAGEAAGVPTEIARELWPMRWSPRSTCDRATSWCWVRAPSRRRRRASCAAPTPSRW